MNDFLFSSSRPLLIVIWQKLCKYRCAKEQGIQANRRREKEHLSDSECYLEQDRDKPFVGSWAKRRHVETSMAAEDTLDETSGADKDIPVRGLNSEWPMGWAEHHKLHTQGLTPAGGGSMSWPQILQRFLCRGKVNWARLVTDTLPAKKGCKKASLCFY